MDCGHLGKAKALHEKVPPENGMSKGIDGYLKKIRRFARQEKAIEQFRADTNEHKIKQYSRPPILHS
jgi:hypothetical protein